MRTVLVALLVFVFGSTFAADVQPGYQIELPRDAGSHPEFLTEWWYLTGWTLDENGARRGFQVTFFRSRNPAADANPSKFSPRQLIFAHAAISDPIHGRLLRAERTARAGFGLADAATDGLDVRVDRWSLRTTRDLTTAVVIAEDFSFEFGLTQKQPPLLHGDNGYSRKGGSAASHYYSLPHLSVKGSLVVKGRKLVVTGEAWFDHEWSNTYVDTKSVGWDWIGLNFLDGGAAMAFRMRDSSGDSTWTSGTRRTTNRTRSLGPETIHWAPLRHWRSPRTNVDYPIAWRIKLGEEELILRPLLDDQENDARGSVGILYWEGAVEAVDATDKVLARGYLELTGYGASVRL